MNESFIMELQLGGLFVAFLLTLYAIGEGTVALCKFCKRKLVKV